MTGSPEQVSPPSLPAGAVRTQCRNCATTPCACVWKPMEQGVEPEPTKPRYDLIPPEALDAIAQVLAEGAAKYEDRGWEKGGSWGKCFSSCMGHLWAWWRGERLDAESGLPHLAHAACRVMFLLAYECREVGEDDRSVGEAPVPGPPDYPRPEGHNPVG